jgi:hypothetical protein
MPLANINPSNLAQFYGSERNYYNPLFRKVKYTEGVKFLSDNGAAWLVIDISSVVLHERKVAKEEFVNVTLTVKDGKGEVVYDDGNGKVLYKQEYVCCDFPMSKINLYYEYGMIMLPSER